MSKSRWYVPAVVAFVLALLVVGNIIFGLASNRNAELQRWPDTDLGADEVVVYKDAPTRPLHLHLFHPDGVRPAPAIVLFHGGGLVEARITQFVPQAERLTAEGFTVAIAEYRVREDGGTPASSIEDAIDSVAWLRTNGADHGIDAERIAAGGASAGGWLAAETAHADSPPDALVLFNPAVSIGDAPVVPLPTIVFHGDADDVVPLDRAENYCDRSPECTLDIWPGGNHGFFNEDVSEDAFDHTTEATITFLAATLT